MRERAIPLSAPMVRAILTGRKTQTRLVVCDRNSLGNVKTSELHLEDGYVDPGPSPAGNSGPYLKAEVKGQRDITERLYPQVVPGDRLWVRETWRGWNATALSNDSHLIELDYRADGARRRVKGDRTQRAQARVVGQVDIGEIRDPWRPSTHMLRWASRITLEVTGVRVERLQDISEADCLAEGAIEWYEQLSEQELGKLPLHSYSPPRRAFSNLWHSINAKRGHGWDNNPWVWVIELAPVVKGE